MGDSLDRSVSGINRTSGIQVAADSSENSLYQAMDTNAAPVTADQL